MGADRTPLAALASALRGAALPRPSVLVTLLAEAESFARLCELIQEYLPEHRAEILAAGGSSAMVQAFAEHFEDRYFPLALPFRWGEVESLDDLTNGIIPQAQGLDIDDYHELPDERLGHVLASLLVDLEGVIELDPGIRVTLLDKAEEAVPGDWLSHVADKGYSLEELEVLGGTDYEGALWHARYLCHETGNWFLDATDEDGMGTMFDWDRPTVEAIAEDWADAKRIFDRMVALYEWLEQSPEEHFRQVLRRIKGIPDVSELQLPLGLAFGD